MEYPSKELEEILGKMLSVPLFQEQAMKIVIVAAGFTPAQADELRWSMVTFKMHGMVTRFEKILVEGMTARGYTEEFARWVFKQLEGFGSHGSTKPSAQFCPAGLCLLLAEMLLPRCVRLRDMNSMPMGFYQPVT